MANAFSQMKDLYKLQKEAKKMQKEMKKIKIEGVSKDGDVKVYINGVQEVEDIEISENLLVPAKKVFLVEAIIEAFKDATKKSQKEMMKDMDMEKMKSMLGGF